ASFDITSVSGYNVNQTSDSIDFTYAYGPIFGGGIPVPEGGKTRKFTEEIRASTPIGSHIDWLLGGFYTHENSEGHQSVLQEDLVTGAILGSLGNFPFFSTYTEYAGFTDLTYHITDQFDVQIGGRESEIRQVSPESTQTGALLGPTGINVV